VRQPLSAVHSPSTPDSIIRRKQAPSEFVITMQYVRNIGDSLSNTWNSINPATLSGAIDVIVVEQDDGTLACSPFHVRFGKFSLLRPYEKKVDFKVNGVKQEYSMKLGEGGEAFFVFETSDAIPQSLQTSPIVSPTSSPPFESSTAGSLQEPPLLELDDGDSSRPRRLSRPGLLASPELIQGRPASGDWSVQRPFSEDILRKTARRPPSDSDLKDRPSRDESPASSDPASPPALRPHEAMKRAMTLSSQLSAVNIPTHVTDTGDLMLDMTGFKNSEEDAIRAEILARKVLSEELDGNYDIGALFGVDEHGNLWIYSSEDAKEAAEKQLLEKTIRPSPSFNIDAASDPGYHSDGTDVTASPLFPPQHRRTESDVGQMVLQTPPSSPGSTAASAKGVQQNYAKTLRLTSDQLKALNLKSGENSMSFTVNRSTCQANMYLWKHETPVVISDIDGTITKSDALGHVLNMIGRDWTHLGVAKLYSDIVANGYNIMYLTSRSVGQADTTRAYLAGVVQDGYRLPKGPTILSPDRTMAALRREIYLRKPHVFKMSTLRDIRNLYGQDSTPFTAGFGNRLTDQISYRTVDVPRNRIFTINSNAEVSLDLLSLNKLKLSYVNMTEVVDHYFPPVATLVKGGGEQYTDFNYWRDNLLDIDDFSASDSESTAPAADNESQYAEDEEEEVGDGLGDSYISRGSLDESVLSGSAADVDEQVMSSILEEEDADDEGGEDEIDRDDIDVDEAERTQVVEMPSAAAGLVPAVKEGVQDVLAEAITGVKGVSLAPATKE
jgi:phosphatidate phosphatase LPIN